MNAKECIAMILAGGRGERLGALTYNSSKPVVHFGAHYRIIDFTLNNCSNSGIDTVGILSQCYSLDLHDYINSVHDNKPEKDGIHILPSLDGEHLYTGTADAVQKNIEFADQFNPDYVLVLAGDHIYNMDYNKMIDFHKKMGAGITIASTSVSIKEASRFGILNADKHGCVYEFDEKPLKPKSTLASMGIYVFNWDILKKYLTADNENKQSSHDFGKNILPEMLHAGESIYTYTFNGYWRDVGTVGSLWEANMEQLDSISEPQLQDSGENMLSSYIDEKHGADISGSIISKDCSISGKVEHSILGNSVTIEKGAEVVNSVIMPGVYIGKNAKIYNTVVGEESTISNNTIIGADSGSDFFIDDKICSKGISLVAPWVSIAEGMKFKSNSHIYRRRLQEFVVQSASA